MSAALQYATVDQSIAQFEGYNTPGTIAQRQNNPGNLIYSDWSASHGAIGAGTNGIAIFPDANTGLSAEDQLVQNYAANGYTVSDLINAWAPPNAPGNTPEATANYAAYVAQQTGSNLDTPLTSLAGSSSPGVTPPFVGTSPTSGASTGILGSIGNTIGSAVMNATFPGVAALNTSWSRIGLFLLGMIVIAAGLYQFKPVQNIVTTGVKAAKTAVIAA